MAAASEEWLKAERTTLANGLKLVVVPMAGVRSVSIALFIGVGSRHESARLAGISHLTEHMMFKGTPRRPRASDISATLESAGGILNASTDKEVTLYWAKVAAEHGTLAMELLADMLVHSLHRPRDIARERQIIEEELRMISDDPQDWSFVLADEILWPDHPLGREIAGSHETVSSFRRRDVLAHVHHYYGARNAVLCVAGQTNLGAAQRLAHGAFLNWTRGEPAVPPPAPHFSLEAPWRLENKSFEQLNVCVAYPGISRDHPDRPVLEMLTTVLGGGASSRLFEQLRERRGLAYDVGASATHYRDTGSIIVSFGTEPPKGGQALDAIFGEIDRLHRRRVLDRELQRAKQFFRGRLWLALEDTNAVAGWFGSQEILQDRVVSPEEAIEAVDRVGQDDILAAARAYLQPETARVSAVGPIGSLARYRLPRGA